MSIFKRIAYWIRERRKLRICETPEQFADYVATKLRTPENIAWWIAQNIEYDSNEFPIRWRTVEDVLAHRNEAGFQYGNCSEMACLAKFAFDYLPEYKAEIACVYGEDENRVRKGHAICCFSTPELRGSINGGMVKFYSAIAPWAMIIAETVPTWMATVSYFATDKGKKIVGDL